MKTEPLVSIIINNYNYDRFLKAAIDSALNQTYSSIEVIVVDDGSTDGSRDIVSSYGNRIIPALKDNGGQASSLNEGVKLSRGNIILFLDSDDVFHPEKAKKVADFFVKANFLDTPIILHNLFEAIDQTGSPIETDMIGNILSLQNRAWRLLSNVVKGYRSFFNGELNQVCSPEQIYEFASRYRYIPYIGMPTSSISISRIMAEKLFPLPIEGYKVSADELVVKAASLMGSVYSTDLVLTQYRFHGSNNWYGKKSTKELEESSSFQRDRYLNSKLCEMGKKPVFSFLDSMEADGFYRHYFGYKSADQLISLAFRVAKWHMDASTFIFFIQTLTRGIYYKMLVLKNTVLKTG